MFEDGKFSWGVSIDNVWTYAGKPLPKSMLLPYVLSMKMPRGPVEILDRSDSGEVVKEQLMLSNAEEPFTELKIICNDLVIRLKEAKIDFVRMWFPWNFFHKTVTDSGEFPMDTLVQELNSNGIEILAVLGNGYTRFLPGGASVDHLQKYVDQLSGSSAEIVRHYKDKIKVWQIENEPNWWKEHAAIDWRSGLIWFESNSDEIILKTLHDVVREECPDSKIVVNVEADRSNVRYDRYAQYCDIMGLDLYPGYAHPHETSADKIRIAEDVKRQIGKQVVIAETGQPSGPQILGYSGECQAKYVKSACETARSCDAIEALCLWRYSDSYWHSFPMQENHFGLHTKEREPKAAWFEYADQIKRS